MLHDGSALPEARGVTSSGVRDRPAVTGARHRHRTRLSRRARLLRSLVTVAAIGVLVAVLPPLLSSKAPGKRLGVAPGAGAPTGRAAAAVRPLTSRSGKGMAPGPNLAPGSDPGVLPGDVLIADEGNNRLLLVNPSGAIVWQFPRPGGLSPGQTFLSPDDAFFSPEGNAILATEETDQVVSLLSVPGGRILWRYGTPGVPGAGPNHLDNPDDAMLLPDGDVLVADIKNCSLLVVAPGAHAPSERIGTQDTACYHQPPLRFGSPNGAFPLTDGNYLVTEINGDWVDEMTLSGKILWSTHPPGVVYPSDTNEVSPGVYLTVDYSTPGQIVEFNRTGKLLWRYGPSSGPGMLNHPSLCEPIPTNGDILCNDDRNDRVVVIDPRTDKIVWQYGHTGVEGASPGFLSEPDGVDLAPPYSMLVRHGPTMGVPSGHCATGLPAGACTIFG